MEKRSIFNKLGEWYAKRKIKNCKKHDWQSYGTVMTCNKCGLTRQPKAGFFFNSEGQELPQKTTSIQAARDHNCEIYGHVVTNADPFFCVACERQVENPAAQQWECNDENN